MSGSVLELFQGYRVHIWPAAGFADGNLIFHSSLLEHHRAYMVDGRVPTPWVVEPLDVVKYISACLLSGTIGFPFHALCLQRREEALHRCVVSDCGSAYKIDTRIGVIGVHM